MLSEKVWFFCPLILCIKNGFCPIEIALKEDCVVCAYSSECPCCAVLNSFQLQASSDPFLSLSYWFASRADYSLIFAEQWLNSFSLGRFSWPGMKTELFSSAVLFSSLLQMLYLFVLLCTHFWFGCCASAAGTQTFQRAASTNKMYKVLMLSLSRSCFHVFSSRRLQYSLCFVIPRSYEKDCGTTLLFHSCVLVLLWVVCR